MQPLPGIGDMIWHLAHIRAVAAQHGGRVTLLAKPRSLADQLFAGEDTVRDIIWLDRNPRGRTGQHDGPLGLWHLVRRLRAGRFSRTMILHHSHTLALAAWAAGIPWRQGYGFGGQRWALNRGPFLPASARRLHQLERATAFLRAAGVPLPDPEPLVAIPQAARQAVAERLATIRRPLVAMGIGSSEPHRQWGAERMAAVGDALLRAGWGGLALIGGPDDGVLAEAIQAGLADPARRVLPALGWHLGEAAALIAAADFYVGNDTGMMNLAAAAGVRSYGLFGASPPLFHSRHIVPITPPGGVQSPDGMRRITPAAVLAAIAADRSGADRRAADGGADDGGAANRNANDRNAGSRGGLAPAG